MSSPHIPQTAVRGGFFDVTTPQARVRLSFERRRKRWTLEALEAA
jgi:hypothetical protein